jgi:hypothetical protein
VIPERSVRNTSAPPEISPSGKSGAPRREDQRIMLIIGLALAAAIVIAAFVLRSAL